MEFDVTTGQQAQFLQDVHTLDLEEQQCVKLGTIQQRLLCVPNVESILGKNLDLIHVQAGLEGNRHLLTRRKPQSQPQLSAILPTRRLTERDLYPLPSSDGANTLQSLLSEPSLRLNRSENSPRFRFSSAFSGFGIWFLFAHLGLSFTSMTDVSNDEGFAERIGITQWSDERAFQSNHTFQVDAPVGCHSFDTDEVPKSDHSFSTPFDHSNNAGSFSMYTLPEEQTPVSYAPVIPQPKGSHSFEETTKPVLFSLPAQESAKVFSPSLGQSMSLSLVPEEPKTTISFAPPEIDCGPRLYGLPVESQSVSFSLSLPSTPLSYNAPTLNDYVVSYAPQGQGIIGENPSQSILAELLRLQDEEFSSYFYAEVLS